MFIRQRGQGGRGREEWREREGGREGTGEGKWEGEREGRGERERERGGGISDVFEQVSVGTTAHR